MSLYDASGSDNEKIIRLISDQKTQFSQERTFGHYSKPVESSPNPPYFFKIQFNKTLTYIPRCL